MVNKYRNRKATIDGEVWDSIKEYRRYCELKLLERAKEIRDLKRQVEFVLIPEQRELATEVYKRGEKKGQLKAGKLLEKKCSYFADFTYYDKNNNFIVEDTKGFKTKDYIIKRKLMLHKYGITIQEI